jgi:anti-sigma factor RsiW
MSVHESQCETFRPELTALLDGELPADQAHAVRRHVQCCEVCRRESGLLERSWDMLGSLEQPRLERSLLTDIMGKIRTGEAEESKVLKAIKSHPAGAGRVIWGVLARCAAAAAVLVIALLLNSRFAGQAPTADTSEPSPSADIVPPAPERVVDPELKGENIDELKRMFVNRPAFFNNDGSEQSSVFPAVVGMEAEKMMKMMMMKDQNTIPEDGGSELNQ